MCLLSLSLFTCALISLYVYNASFHARMHFAVCPSVVPNGILSFLL